MSVEGEIDPVLGAAHSAGLTAKGTAARPAGRRRAHPKLVLAILVLAIAGVAAAAGGAAFAWSGVFDVAATTKHSWPVEWLLHYVMQRSVALHAPQLQVPNLNDPVLI